MSLENILKNLSLEQRDFLLAGMINNWNYEYYLPLDSLKDQILQETEKCFDEVVYQLLNHGPPLIEKKPGEELYKFTKIGTGVALLIFNEPTPPPANPLKIGSTKGIHRGVNNGQMRKYASEIGATVGRIDNERCNFCTHSNVYYIKKGSMLLCQECFANGRRFR